MINKNLLIINNIDFLLILSFFFIVLIKTAQKMLSNVWCEA